MKATLLTIRQSSVLLPAILLLWLFLGCKEGGEPDDKPIPSVNETPDYNYSVPADKGDGWSVANVDDVNIDRDLLEKAVQEIIDGRYVNISSLLISRDGQLVVDELFRTNLDANDAAVGNTDLNVHTMQSTTKSFVSALIGIAIDKGYINSVDDAFYSFFDEYDEFKNWSDLKNDITLKNVLTMRHGWEYNEWDFPVESDQNTLFYIYRNYTDFVKGLLDLPMATEPGETYAYATMASHALGAVVSNQSGKSVPEFAKEHLFEPLQFDKSYWLFSPNNRAMTGCCLFISGRDMTKLGQLYLDKGQWNGTRIISPEWIERSVARSADIDLGFTDGYGYQWWMKEFRVNGKPIDSYFAAGNGGQFIYVIPELNAVISFTGENYGSQTMYQVVSLLQDYLLKAFK